MTQRKNDLHEAIAALKALTYELEIVSGARNEYGAVKPKEKRYEELWLGDFRCEGLADAYVAACDVLGIEKLFLR